MTAPSLSHRALLEHYGLTPKKSFGQNFLADPGIAARIAALASAGSQTVIEIGAGLGALTAPLLERTSHVIAIERDRDLVPVLAQRFAAELGQGRLELLEADAKSVDYLELLQRVPPPVTLAGNLPYQLTGPLLQRSTALAPQLARAVFMLQAEVADRLLAPAGSEHYGGLSVFVQAQYAPRRAFSVGRGAFLPPPKVSSAVVVLEPHPAPLAEETPRFQALVHGAFQQRRKQLRNAWATLAPSERLERAALAAGVSLEARGETLTVEDYARMAQALGSP